MELVARIAKEDLKFLIDKTDMFKIVLKLPDTQKPKLKMNLNVCKRAGIVTRGVMGMSITSQRFVTRKHIL